MENETWINISGFGYEVSDIGNVRSIPKQYNSYKYTNIVKYNAKPYLAVRLNKDGKVFRRKVHRLVASAFIDNPENKKCVNHLNGNKNDNRKVNLEWATHSENSKHAYKTGLNSRKGIKNGRASICDYEVLEIFNATIARQELAKKYKVSLSSIDAIKTGSTWSHITGIVLKNRKPLLSTESVIEIYKSELPMEEILSKYTISKPTYYRIKSKRQWRDILKNVA